MDRLPRECIDVVVEAAAPRPALDGLDLDRMLDGRDELCRLALVSPGFRTCVRAALVHFVVLRTAAAVEALGSAIEDGHVDAERITHLTLSSITPTDIVEDLVTPLYKLLRRQLRGHGVTANETSDLHGAMISGMMGHLEDGGITAIGHRPFCRAFAGLRPRLSWLTTLQVDGMRSLCRAPDDPVWTLPAEVMLVVPPDRNVREETRFRVDIEEEDVARLEALLDHSRDARLHLQIMSDGSHHFDMDQEIECTRPLWPRVHSLTYGSSLRQFEGDVIWRRVLGQDTNWFPGMRRLRMYLGPDADGFASLDDSTVANVQDLVVDCQGGPRARDGLSMVHLRRMPRLRSFALTFTADERGMPTQLDDKTLAEAVREGPSFPTLQVFSMHLIREVVSEDDKPPQPLYIALRDECERRGISLRVTSECRIATAHLG